MRLPSPALIVACLALLLGAGGVAYGTIKTTGQAVNIVDPVNAANGAKVDGSGDLIVKPTLGRSFSRSVVVPNFYGSGLAQVLQTTATLAIDRLNVSIEDTGTSRWDGAVWYETGDASTCNGPLTRIAVAAVPPGESHLDSFQQPLQLKPDVPGHVWCIKASFGPFDASTDGTAYLDVSGSMVSGTLTPPTATPAPATPAGDRR